MELSYEEIERCLYRIFTGMGYTYVNDLLVAFKFPDNKIKQKADLIYQRSFKRAVKDGMLPTEELEKLIESRNLITASDKAKLKRLKGQLEGQEVLLSKTTRVKANQDRIKGVIDRLKKEISTIESKKSSLLFLSAENKAEEERTFYICSQCSYNEDEKTLLWNSYQKALEGRDMIYRDTIMLEFLRFYSGYPVGVIRAIARSNLWRIRYVNSMKTSDPLFGVSSSSYTIDQLNLVYWSNYYQSIYDMMPEDRPSDLIIDDDDSLDAYMKAFYEERNRQDAGRRHNKKRSGKLSAFDTEEVIVTGSHELYQDIEYDSPREAQKLKDRTDARKRTKRG